MADRNNPREEKASEGTLLGSIFSEIVYEAKVDPDQFRLTPPPGFEIVPKPHVTLSEPELIEWLGARARVNNGTFPAEPETTWTPQPRRWSDKTEAERKIYDLWAKYYRTGERDLPVGRFVHDNTVPSSFRYLGVGVKLGAADRIVCWYQLKSTGKYRAVFGDLAVKDVAPKISRCPWIIDPK